MTTSYSPDENQVRLAIDELRGFIKLSLPSEIPGDEAKPSPVPLKKAKRDSGSAVEVISEADVRKTAALSALGDSLTEAESFWHRSKALFEWQDGPLVTAMKEGDMFVLDEINLAEDAVIERLNR